MGDEEFGDSDGVELCEIGSLGVRTGGRWQAIRGERSRAAVATLSLHPTDGVTAEALVEAVWPSPDQPPTARQSLANLVARLRSALGDDFVETTGNGYRLGAHVGSDRTRLLDDVAQASELLDEDPQTALDLTDRCLGRVRGRPWHDVDLPGELEADRALLEQQVHRARRIRGHALAALGRHDEAVATLVRTVTDDPLDESSWLELAKSYAGDDRRVEALRAVRRARRALGEHGVAIGPDAAELERRLLVGEAAAGSVTGEFPETPTALLGRESVLDEVVELLASNAVVTLHGPAGIGKTRLAIELARRVPIERRHFVDLSPVLDVDRVPSALAAALDVAVEPGTAPTDALLDDIGGRPVLLVLDNCEQVVRGVADLVSAVASSCPGCTVIATSRERLGPAAERVVRVEALPTDAGVELFLERARQHGVALAADVWSDAVAELCRSLDGLPLAIELAAARTTVMTPTEISDALDQRFRVLRRPSGTGLEDAISWSWNLLDDEERAALHRLSVFHSGATVDAASTVLGLDRWATLDLAEQLAEKSLLEIRQSPVAPTRFEMLDSIRYFVLADAARAGTIDACRDAHLAWIDALTLRAQGRHGFSGEPGGIEAVDRERHELRAALDHAVSSPERAAAGAIICHRLFGWWRARSATPEGFERLETLLPIARLGPEDRAAAMASLASLARIAAVPNRDVQSMCAEAERLLGEVETSTDRDHVELRLIEATFDDGDPGLGPRLRRLAGADLDDECATALHLLTAWSITNEPEQAQQLAAEFAASVAASAEPTDGHPKEFQGLAAVVTDDVSRAGAFLVEAIDLHLHNEKTFCAVHCAEGVAWLAIQAGELETGRSLLAATEGLRRIARRSRAGFEQQAITGALGLLGSAPEPDPQADLDETIAHARSIAARLASRTG